MSLDPKKLMFRIDAHDSDGDAVDRGVFLCLGDASLKVADSLDDFRSFVAVLGARLDSMLEEIEQNYPEA